MSELSYNRRKARGRLATEFGTSKNPRLSGFSVHRCRVVAKNHGPYARVEWAKRVIRIWSDAVRNGIPASQVQYPQPPRSDKMEIKP